MGVTEIAVDNAAVRTPGPPAAHVHAWLDLLMSL
jgi:hypothetical protein